MAFDNVNNITIPAGIILIILGVVLAGASNLWCWPAFLVILGISLILIGQVAKWGLIGLGASLILFVIARFAEPAWLQQLLK